MTMTISQALRHAKKLKGRIDEARTRAVGAVSFYSDSPPAFDFASQMERAGSASDELADIQRRLAIANATTSIQYGDRNIELCGCVRLLQELRATLAWLKELPVKAQASMNELVHVNIPGEGYRQMARPVECKLPEAAKAEMIDALQEKFDTLNALVEAANHTTPI